MSKKMLSDIAGYENAAFLVKFVQQQFLDSLLDGNLYMNTFKYFIDLEKETNLKGVGDKLEVAHVVRTTNIQIIDPETNQVIANAGAGEMIERYNVMQKLPLFCFAKFKADQFVVVEENNESVAVKLDLSQEDQTAFLETFGDIAVLLPNDFIDKVEHALQQQGTEAAFGEVQYLDFNYRDSKRYKEFEDKSLNILFWKDNFFNYQREARIVITNKLVENSFILNIGDIRDKALVINAKEFLTEAEFSYPKH
ncbi:hypothetical protein ABE288_21000 [Bacillus salipaludis]|uniref:hypothetical protein n=1 Tax=Bacillus salipaludis TaxID=2547811 RepID=UPI003D199BCB